MDFLGDTSDSQLIVSESAMTCILNQYAKSRIGVFDLNEERWNKLFNVNGLKLDTNSIAEHLPIFQQKLGGATAKPQDLRLVINYKDITCFFGQFDSDVLLTYTMQISFSSELEGTELLYDELHLVVSGNIAS